MTLSAFSLFTHKMQNNTNIHKNKDSSERTIVCKVANFTCKHKTINQKGKTTPNDYYYSAINPTKYQKMPLYETDSYSDNSLFCKIKLYLCLTLNLTLYSVIVWCLLFVVFNVMFVVILMHSRHKSTRLIIRLNCSLVFTSLFSLTSCWC